MDSIKSSLETFMKGKSWAERYDRLKEEVFQYPRVREAMASLPEVETKEWNRRLMTLYEFKKEWQHCDACPGLDACPNLMKGYQPTIKAVKGNVELAYHACSIKEREDARRYHQSLIKSLHIPKEILNATFEGVEFDHQSRLDASNAALDFALHAKPGESAMGLYLYGKFGVGKTYLMGATANELADRGIHSHIVYAPDFFREVKQAVSDGTVQEKVDVVKKAPVLILDDLGAETTSTWIRDDILGVILQYRMMEKLPTLYTSNYDYDGLEEHLSFSQKGGIEQLKAKRIMERIKHLTKPIFVEGKNRRELS